MQQYFHEHEQAILYIYCLFGNPASGMIVA